MAGIDHTIICFHNGKLMRSLYKADDDSYESAIPFEYSRDAELIKPKVSTKKMIPYSCSTGRFRQWFGKHFMDLLPRKYIGYFHEDDIRIFTYQSENYNAIFYLKDDESYVMLGGYGHYDNVYTHFFERGYGQGLERKMAKECYRWLFEEVFSYCWSVIFKDRAHEDEADLFRLQKKFHYKNFWDMTREEREEDYKHELIDYDD